MSLSKSERQEILSRIDLLLKDAYTLPPTTESWERRLYIDWELFQLFRRLADTAASEGPSTEEHEQEKDDEQEENDEHPQKPRRRDRPAQLPF